MTNTGDTAKRTRRVTTEDIELFTQITGDRNPLHFDADLPGPGSVFLNVNWNFRAPVRPGDVITAEARVTSRHESKPVTTLATIVTNQNDEVVLDGTAVVWRDPAVEAAMSQAASVSNPRESNHHPHHTQAPVEPANTRRKP
jgi:acyl dehydratase